jgi:hypothetical protein
VRAHELHAADLGRAQGGVLGQSAPDLGGDFLHRGVLERQPEDEFARVPELLDHALAELDLIQRGPDPFHRHRLLEAHLNEGAAGEVDAVPEAALHCHGTDPDEDEGDGQQVGPAAPANEIVVRIVEELDHIDRASCLREPM